jgi:hypothetical protein
MVPPNKIAALNCRWRIQFGQHGLQFGFGCIGCSLPAPVSEFKRSAGAGVESVVAVDFRNRMTDGVLKQQC